MSLQIIQRQQAISPVVLQQVEQDILNIPALKDLTKEQLDIIAKMVIADQYKKELARNVDILRIDYSREKDIFLNQLKSEHTKAGYTYALKDFERYTLETKELKSPLEVSRAIADDYIYFLREQGKSPATIDRNIGAIGSFLSFLERRTNGIITNVFRGTKARPKKRAVTNSVYPAAKDVEVILANLENKTLKAIVLIMAKRGLRVGAFPAMKIYAGKFYTETKGKQQSGELPPECIEAVRKAGLSLDHPFNNLTADRIKNLFKWHTKRLAKSGTIASAYSCHDLRHYYAMTEYSKDKDIYRVSKLLNHASIGVTEHYLKGLKVLE